MTDPSALRRHSSAAAALVLVLAAAVLPARAGAECPALDLGLAYALSGDCGPGPATGDPCFISCNTANGYIGSAAPSTSTCQADGTWTATTATGCVQVQCPAFVPPPGYVASCPSTAWGSVCSIACDSSTGYVGTPTASSSTCQGSGTWSPSPASLAGCQVAQCAPFVAPPGYLASCTSTSYGGVCQFSCDSASGYVGTPSATSAFCQLDQTWSAAPGSLGGCVLASCGAPPSAPAGYSLSCGGTSFGDTCAIACATGYLGVPSSASMTCGLPGWSVNVAELAGCAAVDCGALVVANANASDCTAHSRYGETCAVACEAGYSGSPAASCTAAGTWAVTGSCEPIACYSVPDTNGDPCGDPGEACLSGACVLPAAGQLCSAPVDVELGVAQSIALDGLHDLLAVQCASPVAPGRDLFVRATVSAGDHRIAVDGASGPVQAFVLDGCPETRCDPVDLSASAPTRSAALSFASGGSVIVAVRLLDPQDAETVAVTLERTPLPPGPDDSGGCAAGSGRGVAFALVLAILALGRSRRRAGAR